MRSIHLKTYHIQFKEHRGLKFGGQCKLLADGIAMTFTQAIPILYILPDHV